MTEQELLDRVLAFWQRVVSSGAASEELRQELVRLLFAHRAQGLAEGARLLRQARRSYGHDDIDAVSRYVLAQVQEELERRAQGHPPRTEPQKRLSRDTPN